MNCSFCQSRGQTWAGDPPTCAFPLGVFDPGNWNCATMNALRERIIEKGLCMRHDDDSLGVLPLKPDFLVLHWYKDRGRTELAYVIGPDAAERLTLAKAEEMLARIPITVSDRGNKYHICNPGICSLCDVTVSEEVGPQIPVNSLQVNVYRVLARCVEEGLEYGWHRAHKHTDNPDQDTILDHMEQAVMNSICEMVEFPD